LTDFKLDMHVVIEAYNYWRERGRPQIAMHYSCPFSRFYFFSC